MDYIIEVLGFRDSHNKFVLKEVAVVALGKEYIAHWIAAAPHSFCDLPIKIQVFNNWLTSNHHGIEWFDGDIPHRQLHANLRELTRSARQIFVKGSQESAIIQSITTRHVENLENYNCPPLHQLNKSDIFCCFHGAQCTQAFMCALNNAVRIKSWINQNITLMSTLNSYHNRNHYENTEGRSVYRTVADCVSYSTYTEPYSEEEEPQDLSIKLTKPSKKSRTDLLHHTTKQASTYTRTSTKFNVIYHDQSNHRINNKMNTIQIRGAL